MFRVWLLPGFRGSYLDFVCCLGFGCYGFEVGLLPISRPFGCYLGFLGLVLIAAYFLGFLAFLDLVVCWRKSWRTIYHLLKCSPLSRFHPLQLRSGLRRSLLLMLWSILGFLLPCLPRLVLQGRTGLMFLWNLMQKICNHDLLMWKFSLIDRLILSKGDKHYALTSLKDKLNAIWKLPSWRLISLGRGYY